MQILVVKTDVPHHSGTSKLKKDMVIGLYDNGDETITIDNGSETVEIARPDGSGGDSKNMILPNLTSTYVEVITTAVAKPAGYMAQKYLWQGGAFVLDPAWVAPSWA